MKGKIIKKMIWVEEILFELAKKSYQEFQLLRVNLQLLYRF